MRIANLRDWSGYVFDDPLMAIELGDHPLRDFLCGFSKEAEGESVNSNKLGHTSMNSGIIDLDEEEYMRLLLYQCYHVTVAVVKEFYRPLSGSTYREFAAHKRLNAVLARLDEMEMVSRNEASEEGQDREQLKSARGHFEMCISWLPYCFVWLYIILHQRSWCYGDNTHRFRPDGPVDRP